MACTRLDSAKKRRRRRQRYKENQEKKRAAKAKWACPPLAEEERNERRRRKHRRYNEKRKGSQGSFAPPSQDSLQHTTANASISTQQNHRQLIVETVGADEADESDDDDELPDTNAILQASQQSIHVERMEAVMGGPSEPMQEGFRSHQRHHQMLLLAPGTTLSSLVTFETIQTIQIQVSSPKFKHLQGLPRPIIVKLKLSVVLLVVQ
ncbi:unnamed protein product [Cylindrotheca closterium]|uniref:Uncharacterized protein n=1 Tax=Cylindrotheca closterium TaxID=2856 RepID=A0AAD2FMG6_9STRA|nr:unnamed protein product [Cylindrotheca closterium]